MPQHRPFWVAIRDIDIYSGMRDEQRVISDPNAPEYQRRQSIESMQQEKMKWYNPMVVVRALF